MLTQNAIGREAVWWRKGSRDGGGGREKREERRRKLNHSQIIYSEIVHSIQCNFHKSVRDHSE
jgi:hypothetical protein